MSPRIRTPRRAPAVALALFLLPALILSACAQATPAPVVPTAVASAAIAPPTQLPPTEAPAAPTATPEPLEAYRIGAVLSLGGYAAVIGDNERKGLELAIEQVNAAGGIDGHPVELLLEDDESDPTKAVAAMLKLIAEGNLAAIIGPSTSSAALASMDAIRSGGIPVVTMAGAAQISQTGNPYVFRAAPTDAVTVRVVLDYLKYDLGVTKLALLHTADAFGVGGADTIAELAPSFGMEVVAREAGQPTDTDFTTQLTNIKATDAEALFIWAGSGPPAAAAAKNVTQLGITLPLFFPSGTNQAFVEAAGESANGIRFAGPKIAVVSQLPEGDPQSGPIRTFAGLFNAAYGTPPDLFSGLGWDAANAVIEALARAASGDPTAVWEALNQTSYSGVTGVYYWSPADHDGYSPESLLVVAIEGGKFVLAD